MLHRHVEVLGDATLQVIEDARSVSVVETAVVNDDVGTQRRKSTRDERGVEIVHAFHMVDLQEMCTDVVEVQARWRGLQEDTDGVAEQAHRSGQDECAD